MLVLKRKFGEEIIMMCRGVEIRIKHIGPPGQIGIDAPPEVQVLRKEVVKRGNKHARRPDTTTRSVRPPADV